MTARDEIAEDAKALFKQMIGLDAKDLHEAKFDALEREEQQEMVIAFSAALNVATINYIEKHVPQLRKNTTSRKRRDRRHS